MAPTGTVEGEKNGLARLGTTDWSGWSIRENTLGYNVIQPTNAWLMCESELKTNTVFKIQPSSMDATSISRSVLDAHLSQGIAARTPAVGFVSWGGDYMIDRNFNMNLTDDEIGIPRPNGWPIRTFGWLMTTTWETEWLHSDMKDVSYFFNHKFFEKVIEKGNMK